MSITAFDGCVVLLQNFRNIEGCNYILVRFCCGISKLLFRQRLNFCESLLAAFFFSNSLYFAAEAPDLLCSAAEFSAHYLIKGNAYHLIFLSELLAVPRPSEHADSTDLH